MRRLLLPFGAVCLGIALACGGGGSTIDEIPMPGVDASADQAGSALAEARSVAGSHQGETPDVCDYQSWVYEVLTHLNDAMEADPEAARDALDTDPALSELAETPLFVRWKKGWDHDFDSAEGLQAFLEANAGWNSEVGMPSSLLIHPDGTFAVRRVGQTQPSLEGTWSVQGDTIRFEPEEEGAFDATVRKGPWYPSLDLGDYGIYRPDPIVGDC